MRNKTHFVKKMPEFLTKKPETGIRLLPYTYILLDFLESLDIYDQR